MGGEGYANVCAFQSEDGREACEHKPSRSTIDTVIVLVLEKKVYIVLCVHVCLFEQLVYKVKMSSILERLTSESVGDDGQAAWLELVVQAKETLNKTKVFH